MSGLMPLADAQKAVLAGAATLGEETVALDDACDRVLSRDIAALRSQPPHPPPPNPRRQQARL